MKIAISGELGSGKTILSNKLSETFGLEIISVGKIQRKIAEEKGMSTLEFNKYIEEHPEFDVHLDKTISDYGKTDSSYIFDSRLAWNFVPNSFKIHLLVNTDIAAKRIFNDQKRVSEEYIDIESAKLGLIERKESEQKRFMSQYNVDINDFDNYDLVIDTSYSSPETIFKTILDILSKWKKNESFNPIYFSPKTLIPTQGVQEHSIRHTKTILESIQSQGFFEDCPVSLLKYKNNYFIYEGHKRTSSSILLKLELIPCEELRSTKNRTLNASEYLQANYSLKNVYDWEALHQFKYPSYIKIQ